MLLARSGVDVETAAPRIAWHFAVFQFAIFFLFSLTAIRRLPRAVVWGKPSAEVLSGKQRVLATVVQAERADRKPTDPPPILKPEKEPVARPPVGDWPVVWWERYGWLNAGQMSFVDKVFTWRLAVVFGFSLVTFGGFRVAEWISPSDPRSIQGRIDILLVPVYLVSLFFLLVAPFRAARCVAREREADTLDQLLLLPLTRREILFEKWMGVCLGDWPGFAGLLAWFLPAVLTGHVPLVVAAMFIVGWIATLSILVALGLYFSVVSKTPGQAVFRLVIFLIVLSFTAGGIVNQLPNSGQKSAAIAGVVPPVGFLIMNEELRGWGPPKSRVLEPGVIAFGWGIGLIIYGSMGLAAWRIAGRRFENERAD